MDGSASHALPRFNMPFELGLDIGMRCAAPGKLSQKRCLVLERERYRYQAALSDISGNDIKAHEGKPEILVREVRNCSSSTLASESQAYKDLGYLQ